MVELKLSLPDWAGQYVQQQIEAGNYSSVDALIAELIDQARAMSEDERLAELIREGLESSEGEEINDDWWERIDAKVRQELERRQSA